MFIHRGLMLSTAGWVNPAINYPTSFTYNGSPAGGTVSPWNNFSIGTEAADRIVVIACSFRTTVPFSLGTGMTIDGNAMTLAVNHTLVTNDGAIIYYLPWPTGTTADFAWGGTNQQPLMATYSIYGANSPTPVSTAAAASSLTVNALIGDLILAVGHERGVSSSNWTNGMGEDFVYNPGSNFGVASQLCTVERASIGANFNDFCAAVWR